MVSYGAFIAITCFTYHDPKRHIGFAPKLKPEKFKAAFTAAEGWGIYSQKISGGGGAEGGVDGETWAGSDPDDVIGAPRRKGGAENVGHGGWEISRSAVTEKNGSAEVIFSKDLILKAEHKLEVTLSKGWRPAIEASIVAGTCAVTLGTSAKAGLLSKKAL